MLIIDNPLKHSKIGVQNINPKYLSNVYLDKLYSFDKITKDDMMTISNSRSFDIIFRREKSSKSNPMRRWMLSLVTTINPL